VPSNIPKPSQSATKGPKPAPAPQAAAPAPAIAQQKPSYKYTGGSNLPVWEQGPSLAKPPIENTPGYVAVFAEEPVPAPAPAPGTLEDIVNFENTAGIATAPSVADVSTTSTGPTVVSAPAPSYTQLPVGPATVIEEVIQAEPLFPPSPPRVPPSPRIPPPSPKRNPISREDADQTSTDTSHLFIPYVDPSTTSSSPSNNGAPFVPPPTPSAAAPPTDGGVSTSFTGPVEQPTIGSNVTAREEFVVAPGLDMVLRDGGGADPWPIPDWSWAGYAGGNYKPVMPEKEFNVMDYGAKHDGFVDDAPAIQAAVDAAGNAGGGIVYLPAGKYVIRNQITMSKSNVVLRGAGKTLTILFSPMPLSEVVKDGRQNINSVGQSRFSWADGFVRIAGEPLFSRNTTLLGKVMYGKSRGWTALNVDTPEKFKEGMWVRLYMSDPLYLPTKESLASSLYNNEVESSACGEKCLKGLRGMKDLIRWAVKVKAIDGNKIILERPLPMDVNPRWEAELHSLPEEQMPHDCGIENIGIEFALQRMKPHLKEAGFNGIAIEHSLNCWVKNVDVINSDNAIVVRYSHHISIDGIDIYADGDRTVDPKFKTQGHIGIGLYEASDVEVENFNLRSKMLHDTTVRGTILCVFHNGRGIDLNLDSHRGAPFGTLYSSIDLGAATRVFTSGGAGGNGFPAAAYTTYWNLRAGTEGGKLIQIPSKTALGECTYGTKLAFQGKFVGKGCKSYYMSKKETPEPADLFASQVYKRLSGVSI
jgi:hypothetical protein